MSVSQSRRPVRAEDLFKLRFLLGADLSTDGSTALYAVTRSELTENRDYIGLFVPDVPTAQSRRLTPDPAVPGSPSISPDERSIAFLSMSTGSAQIYVIPIEGGDASDLVDGSRSGGRSVWSRDEKALMAAM